MSRDIADTPPDRLQRRENGKKIARENGASESERESLPDTELRPSSAECSCLRDFAKSMQTAKFPYSRVSLPHRGSSLEIKSLQLFEILTPLGVKFATYII